MHINIKLVRPNAQLPVRGTHGAAGWDLFACEDVTIPAGGEAVIPLGIVTEFSREYVALLWDRGGMGKKGIHRYAGVVDSDYRGEWMAILHNSTLNDYAVQTGDRVVQVLFQRVETPDWTLVGDVTTTDRGEGRFASTGR